MIVVLIILGFAFASFCGSLGSSIAILVFTWNTKSRLQKNDQLCFLSIILGIGLWVAILNLLFDPLVNDAAIGAFISLIAYATLAGATPIAALPGIYLFGGKSNRSRKL